MDCRNIIIDSVHFHVAPTSLEIKEEDKDDRFALLRIHNPHLLAGRKWATTMLGESNWASGDARPTIMHGKTDVNDSSGENPRISRSTMERNLRTKYSRRPMKLVKRYFHSLYEAANHACYVAFLMECRDMRIVPRIYRVDCPGIKHTRHVKRILDKSSYRLMVADIGYHKLRMSQLNSFLQHLRDELEKMMSTEDLNAVLELAAAKCKNVIAAADEKHCHMIDELMEEYGIDQQEEEREQELDSEQEEDGEQEEVCDQVEAGEQELDSEQEEDGEQEEVGGQEEAGEQEGDGEQE